MLIYGKRKVLLADCWLRKTLLTSWTYRHLIVLSGHDDGLSCPTFSQKRIKHVSANFYWRSSRKFDPDTWQKQRISCWNALASYEERSHGRHRVQHFFTIAAGYHTASSHLLILYHGDWGSPNISHHLELMPPCWTNDRRFYLHMRGQHTVRP